MVSAPRIPPAAPTILRQPPAGQGAGPSPGGGLPSLSLFREGTSFPREQRALKRETSPPAPRSLSAQRWKERGWQTLKRLGLSNPLWSKSKGIETLQGKPGPGGEQSKAEKSPVALASVEQTVGRDSGRPAPRAGPVSQWPPCAGGEARSTLSSAHEEAERFARGSPESTTCLLLMDRHRLATLETVVGPGAPGGTGQGPCCHCALPPARSQKQFTET